MWLPSAAGASCRPHEHFLLVHGLDFYKLPLNIAAPARLPPLSAGAGSGGGGTMSAGYSTRRDESALGRSAESVQFSASDVFPALKAFALPFKTHRPVSVTPKMADLLGSILSSMEKPPSLGDQETRRKARGEDPKFTSAFLHPVLRTALFPLWTLPPLQP